MTGSKAALTAGTRLYRLKIRVYYEDTDAGGIVYHARYLAFAERGRTEALRQAGVPHDELVTQFGLIFVVRRIKMDYLRPVRLDAELVVETGPWALGGATVDVQQRSVAQCLGPDRHVVGGRNRDVHKR